MAKTNSILTYETRNERVILKKFFDGMKALRQAGILINKKDFTCQIGEWLVEMIYEGKRSSNGIEKGWDVLANEKYIQVKTHSKAETNSNRCTTVNKEYDIQIDVLIIIVFTQDYKLKEFYHIPWDEAMQHIKSRENKNIRSKLNWKSVSKHRVEIDELPHQEVVQLFK